jgi:hypothetical protein
MATVTDPTFNIAGFQISEAFSPTFLQSGSPLANDINSFSHIKSLSDFVSLAVQTYNDIVHGGISLKYENTNVLTVNPGISLVLSEGSNTIGAIGVSGLSSDASHLISDASLIIGVASLHL